MITGLGYVYSNHVPLTPKRRLVQEVSDRLYRLALRGLKVLFVYNPDDEQEMASRGLLREVGKVVRVAGSGVDLNHYAAAALPSGPPSFLMTARLLREKGVEEYVAAARMLRARYPDIRVRLLGPFYSHPTSISRDELNGWVKEGVIEYLGATDDVRPYLADCSVFVLPSYYREGIPRTILEAMAMGRAIVTTDSSGCRETVTQDVNGILVPPRDPAALAAAMERFVRDPDLAPRMGQRSREMAEERFDVRRVNRVLLEHMDLVSPEPAVTA
jgi:glycosyltransferase involved in cell wall biosynthesis